MFILGPERDRNVKAAFNAYLKYINDNKHRFPSSAYALATSDWYYGFSEHKAPHDSWLVSSTIAEAPSEIRETSLTIRLLSAYHDGHIEFHYPSVFEYDLGGRELGQGHGDWRYDEFRLDEKGRLIHEIEWAGFGVGANWRIVASDVHHKWIPGK